MADNTNFQEALKRFKEAQTKIMALQYASSMMFWDSTTGAPKSGADARSRAVGTLSGFSYELLVNKQMQDDLKELVSGLDSLDEMNKVMVREAQKEYDKLTKIPMDEFQKYHALVSKASMVWEDAKAKSDFEMFKPYLTQIIDYKRKFAEYRGYTGHPYNLYIDDYEEGMDVKQLDAFFDELKARLVPLIKSIAAKNKNIDTSFFKKSYPVKMQEQLARELLKQMGYDLDRGLFKESVHPFTMGVDIDDVRLTTHYYENDFTSSLFSTAHEGGHAIYEQNISRSLQGTFLATGTSNGIHESQSRIYENNFVRSEAFLSHLFPKLQSMFSEQLGDVSLQSFYEAINLVEPSFIRIEADELTYSLHIMVRYEIELGLIDGSIQVDDLPKVWNKKIHDYLGITPANDAQGVLQDVHWSDGLFGYFPTYALGSAYAAQLAYHMAREVDIDSCLKKGDFAPLTKWLNEKIHVHGSLVKPVELVKMAVGETLNAKYYCDYLENKYRKIYGI
jgi:carboxypeptidase Taq